MKTYFYLLVLIFVTTACGGSDDPTPPTVIPPENEAPTAPTLSYPTDELLCTENPLEFIWNASSDPNGDAISYELQTATNNSFTENVQTITTSTIKYSLDLLKGKAYYWRVRAKDSKNAYSPYATIRKYFTEGEGLTNHIPYAPSIVSPEMNASVNTTTVDLTWSGSDVDNDPLKYDVYFSTSDNPTLVVENTEVTTYNASITAGNTYYWKITVKDDKGGESIGQVWSFKAE